MSASNKEKIQQQSRRCALCGRDSDQTRAATGPAAGTASSASQISALQSSATSRVTLVVGKSIYFPKTPLLIHFLMIRNFWDNHWKPSLLQTANVMRLQHAWDLFYSRRGPLFPPVAMVMLQHRGCVFNCFPPQSYHTLKSNHLFHVAQVFFWKQTPDYVKLS